jgi:hypothetical protein
MKNLISILTAIVIFTIVFTACNHPNREKRINKIDSLSMVLTKVDSMLTYQINHDDILSRFNELKKNQEAMSPYFLKLTQKEKSDYDQYTSSEKHFKNLIASFENYKKELEYSNKQINDLREDVNNKAIKKDKFEEFYVIESKAVYNLLNVVKTEVYKTNKHIEKNNLYLPIVLQIIESKSKTNKK